MTLKYLNLVSDPLKKLIIWNEGLSRKIYTDTTGHPTIGVGRNLQGKGITVEEALYLFSGDLENAKTVANSYVGDDIWDRLSDVRRGVLIDMAYNMGARLRQFRKLKDYLFHANYDKAAQEMLASRWAVQVGRRADRLARMMRTNSWPLRVLPKA